MLFACYGRVRNRSAFMYSYLGKDPSVWSFFVVALGRKYLRLVLMLEAHLNNLFTNLT